MDLGNDVTMGKTRCDRAQYSQNRLSVISTVVKNEVKYIQAAAYNGARKVSTKRKETHGTFCFAYTLPWFI